MSNAIVWFRNDLRLADNPALQAALEGGYTPIPVYIHAPEEEQPPTPGGITPCNDLTRVCAHADRDCCYALARASTRCWI
jgi:hypothetical protein